MKTTNEIKTKSDSRAQAVTTNLTIDWDGITQEDLIEMARAALTVKLQGAWRNSTIPEGDFEVKAVDYKPGTRAARGPVDPLALFKKMTPEQQAEFLARAAALAS
jgi:hypothetical protein